MFKKYTYDNSRTVEENRTQYRKFLMREFLESAIVIIIAFLVIVLLFGWSDASKADGIGYGTYPYTTIRDYDQPASTTRRNWNGSETTAPTWGYSTLPDYDKPEEWVTQEWDENRVPNEDY